MDNTALLIKKWDEIIKKYILCSCGEVYTSRGMAAPDRPYHAQDWETPMLDFLKELAAQSSPIEDKRAKSLEILKRYIKETPPEEVAALVEKYSKSDIGTAAIEETKKWSDADMIECFKISKIDWDYELYKTPEDYLQSLQIEDKTQVVKETAEQISQWVIDNRYPKSEKEKVSDFELYNSIIDKIIAYANQFK